MALTTLHLVRHGESTWNEARRLQGQTHHPPLTACGREQAHAAAEALRGRDISAVITSDLLRARQTAEIIARRLDSRVLLDPRLREQRYGVLEGTLTVDALQNPGYDLLDPDGHAEGGESLRDVYRRTASAIADLVVSHAGCECVIVSHGDSLRALLAWLHGHPVEEVRWHELANGCTTTVAVEEAGLRNGCDLAGAALRVFPGVPGAPDRDRRQDPRIHRQTSHAD